MDAVDDWTRAAEIDAAFADGEAPDDMTLDSIFSDPWFVPGIDESPG